MEYAVQYQTYKNGAYDRTYTRDIWGNPYTERTAREDVARQNQQWGHEMYRVVWREPTDWAPLGWAN